jgi:hypothetical protein
MIMKRKLTLGLVVTLAGVIAAMNVHLNRQKNVSSVSLYSIEVLADEQCTCEQSNDASNPIYLMGCLSSTAPRSLSMPFSAIKSQTSIEVYYLVNQNNITIKIVKASGQIVYSNTVNPVAGGQLSISIANLPEGEYTIVFTAPNGNSISGDFEIECEEK